MFIEWIAERNVYAMRGSRIVATSKLSTEPRSMCRGFFPVDFQLEPFSEPMKRGALFFLLLRRDEHQPDDAAER